MPSKYIKKWPEGKGRGKKRLGPYQFEDEVDKPVRLERMEILKFDAATAWLVASKTARSTK